MEEVIIASAVRTAVAKEAGALKYVPPQHFGAAVVKEALSRAGVDGREVVDVIIGNCMNAGGNMARLVSLQAGLPVEVPGVTIDRQCSSGLQAICMAGQAIRAGDGEVYVAGGVESMTRIPFVMERPLDFSRTPPRFVRFQLSPDEIGNPPMGVTAENVAEQHHVSREDQDRFALSSQQRAARAIAEGRFREQIVPLSVPAGKGSTVSFDTDEHPRADTSLEKLAKLPTIFKPGGTVTAGTSSGINDGAGACVVISGAAASRRGVTPLARLVAHHAAGVDPNTMGMGPVPAVRGALKKAGLTLDQIDVIELNEAFASQALACMRELGMDPERVNPNGGAIALGHPIAATGAILTAKLIYELRRTGGKYGIVTMCIGGGQGLAAIFERL